MRSFLIFAILVLLVAPASAFAQENRLSVEVRDFGIYESEIVGKYAAPRTVARTGHRVTNIRLVRKTRTVMAQPGLSFGFRYRIDGRVLPTDRLISRTIHPPLTNPETGRTQTVSETDIGLTANFDEMYDAYGFDHRWEMAEGIWRFQVVHNGRVIHEQRFRVVIPLN